VEARYECLYKGDPNASPVVVHGRRDERGTSGQLQGMRRSAKALHG